VCDPFKEDPETGKVVGGWDPIYELCETDVETYPGACRVKGCDLDFGGCVQPSLNNTYCEQFNGCEEYECTPLDEALGDDAFTQETGCRIKKNYTKSCIESLGPKFIDNGGCYEVVCDGSSTACSDMMIDTCVERNDNCYTYSCDEFTPGQYKCMPHEIGEHRNTSCTTWVCKEEGWTREVERDEDYCLQAFKAKEGGSEFIKCKNFGCDPSAEVTDPDLGGCYAVEREHCDFRCDADKEESCIDEVNSSSSVTECKYSSCVVIAEGETQFELSCLHTEFADDPSLSENCLSPDSNSYKKAVELNAADPSKCYTPFCDSVRGRCSVEEVPLEEPGDRCMEPSCVQKLDGSWGWTLVPTKENRSCESDACYSRVCDPTDGCVVRDICTSLSNECVKWTCDTNEDGTLSCNDEDLTVNFVKMECAQEECIDGKKKMKYYPDNCTSDNKCVIPSCVKGSCIYTDKAPDNDDICYDPQCDPKTGTFSYVDLCDDGLYCTMDECWNYGDSIECHHENVDCSAKISMEGFECFVPACKEDRNNNNYKCQRKLIPSAYIDVCGNCIRDLPIGASSSVSAAESEENVLLTCTGAPPRPLMIESLAAATIALIIIGAVVAGGVLTTSTVIGTKTLIDRVREASNQSAQSNPLYEGAETELMNPTYAGGAGR